MRKRHPYFIFNTGIQVGSGGGGGGGGTTITSFTINDSNFSGNDYTDSRLIGKTYISGFKVFSYEGFGGLLTINDAFTFNSVTGTLTFPGGPGNYMIEIYT